MPGDGRSLLGPTGSRLSSPQDRTIGVVLSLVPSAYILSLRRVLTDNRVVRGQRFGGRAFAIRRARSRSTAGAEQGRRRAVNPARRNPSYHGRAEARRAETGQFASGRESAPAGSRPRMGADPHDWRFTAWLLPTGEFGPVVRSGGLAPAQGPPWSRASTRGSPRRPTAMRRAIAPAQSRSPRRPSRAGTGWIPIPSTARCSATP